MAIGRAERYSPNSVDKDAAILRCVADALRQDGFDVETTAEADFCGGSGADVYLSMGRAARTLEQLAELEGKGAIVVNGTAGVALCCNRRRLTEVLRQGGVPVAPSTGSHGYWLKRASGVAEGPLDVRYAASEADVPVIMADMKRRGISDVIVSAHVVGDLLKFYGVRSTGFFRFYYPGDDGQWKFGDERRNGRPHHYRFSHGALHAMAERAAINAPMQGSAADIIKKAMVEVMAYIQTLPADSVHMTLQVHDELVFEVKEEILEEFCAQVKTIMEQVVTLSVPLEVGIGVGKSWADAH